MEGGARCLTGMWLPSCGPHPNPAPCAQGEGLAAGGTHVTIGVVMPDIHQSRRPDGSPLRMHRWQGEVIHGALAATA